MGFLKVDVLKGLENFLSEITFELVIIFRFDVDNELQVIGPCTLGKCLDRCYVDPSLNRAFVDVIQILVSYQ